MFIFSIIFMLLNILFLILFNNMQKAEKSDDCEFALFIPKTVLFIGALDMFASCVLILAFSLFSDELPPAIFYIICLFFFLLGEYLCYYAIRFKVFVGNNKFIIYPLFSKSNIVLYDNIVNIERQVKNNNVNSERLIITTHNKKYIVEKACVNYKKFLKFISNNVPHEKLSNFFIYRI